MVLIYNNALQNICISNECTINPAQSIVEDCEAKVNKQLRGIS